MKNKYIIPLIMSITILSSCKDTVNQEAKKLGIDIYNAIYTTLNNSNTLGVNTIIKNAKLDYVSKVNSNVINKTTTIKLNNLTANIDNKYANLLNMKEYIGNIKYKSFNTYKDVSIDGSYSYADKGVAKQSISFDTKGSFNLLKDYLVHNVEVSPKEGETYTAYGDYLNFENGEYASLLKSISDSIKFSGYGKWDIKETLNEIAEGIQGEYKLSKLYFNDDTKFSSMFDPFKYLMNYMSNTYLDTKKYLEDFSKEIKEGLRIGFTAMMGAYPDSIKIDSKDDNTIYTFKLNYEDINEMISSFESIKDFKVISGSLSISLTVSKDSKILSRSIIADNIKTETLKYSLNNVNYEHTFNEFSMNLEDYSDYSITEAMIDKSIEDAMKLNWKDCPFNLDEY